MITGHFRDISGVIPGHFRGSFGAGKPGNCRHQPRIQGQGFYGHGGLRRQWQAAAPCLAGTIEPTAGLFCKLDGLGIKRIPLGS